MPPKPIYPCVDEQHSRAFADKLIKALNTTGKHSQAIEITSVSFPLDNGSTFVSQLKAGVNLRGTNQVKAFKDRFLRVVPTTAGRKFVSDYQVYASGIPRFVRLSDR